MALEGESSTRTNRQIILVLIHLVRVAIFIEFAALMWYDFLTWSPIPPLPGGPPVAQFRPLLPTILMTAVVIIRILIARSIWFRDGRNLAYAASADAVEIGIIIAVWGLRLVLYGFDAGDLLILIILSLSSCSLILCLIFIYWEMTMKTSPDQIV
ncbi:MAG: hypothetical protein ACFFF9_14205 [Candidatus Thorarchaeota archaeon]